MLETTEICVDHCIGVVATSCSLSEPGREQLAQILDFRL